MTQQTTDVLVIGSGFGGAIPAYHLAAGGARVTVLERGPYINPADFTHNLQLGSYNRIVDVIKGDGISVVAGNCVGGSSVVYFGASLRAPAFVFDRRGSSGHRLWPAAHTREGLDPWYDRAEQALPVARQGWDDISYAGGVLAAACANAGRTCNPVPLAVEERRCRNCNWMLSGCRFGAKRSLLLNYLPAAQAHGAEVRPLSEAQTLCRSPLVGYQYAVTYLNLDPGDYTPSGAGETIHAKVVVLAAGAAGTPVILKRSARLLGGVPEAVGMHFSGNGDRVSVAVLNEDRVRTVLGLSRPGGAAYDAMHIGKPITAATFDYLDPQAAEFTRCTLQQIYFPPITNTLASVSDVHEDWFGIAKRNMRGRWRSWLTLLAMTEDDNEGTFGPPPFTGSFVRIAPGLGRSALAYHPTSRTRRGWDLADDRLRDLFERDGLSTVTAWSEEFLGGAVTAHPLSSCRMGDHPTTSALNDFHELRGYKGLFITDASAIPTSLTVNPSLTVAALAERAVPGIVARAAQHGAAVRYGAGPPDGTAWDTNVSKEAQLLAARAAAGFN
ncbi:FAD-dependent oxidoreductase [Streptomyces sp. NPDC015127]|uniref:FAD-dependent oxidoreductase n=1 Tax=Streptomyces sp. NPDC015127 TaxID=3364939 RepID=UPI0036FAF46A